MTYGGAVPILEVACGRAGDVQPDWRGFRKKTPLMARFWSRRRNKR
jgi:hypothetical protein